MPEIIKTSKLDIEELKLLAKKQKDDLTQQQQVELMRLLSVRERLERKLSTDEIHMELSDDLGKFTLKFRKLTPLEHDELAGIQEKMRREPAKAKELTARLYEIVGGASLDGLDKTFWESGTGFSADVFVSALLKIMASSAFPDQKYMDEIIKFRTV